jgi:hypothetical protein
MFRAWSHLQLQRLLSLAFDQVKIFSPFREPQLHIKIGHWFDYASCQPGSIALNCEHAIDDAGIKKVWHSLQLKQVGEFTSDIPGCGMIVDVHLSSINLKDMGSIYEVCIFSSASSWYNQRIRTGHCSFSI